MSEQTPLSVVDQIVFRLVAPGSKVLDLGCGDGTLIDALAKNKGAKVQGIEISQEAIYACVEKGLSVFHGDIDSGLSEYPDNAFDYVVLNQTLQEVKQVDFVMQEALRVGKNVVVSFPNYAYWPARLQMLFQGHAPVMKALPYSWFDTPNVRFLSIRDFGEFCARLGFKVLRTHFSTDRREIRKLPNVLALYAVFVLEGKNNG